MGEVDGRHKDSHTDPSGQLYQPPLQIAFPSKPCEEVQHHYCSMQRRAQHLQSLKQPGWGLVEMLRVEAMG